MSDSFSVTSGESWFGRIIGSIGGVLVGLVLFIGAFPLLYWNEGRAVRTERSLKEGLGAVVSIQPDSVNPANDGKLVHVSGPVKTSAPVADDELPMHADGVKLLRTVEMYQWTEHESRTTHKKLGGGTETVTTYNYQTDWKPGRVDSSTFKKPEGHENPQAPPFESKTFSASPVTVGAFTMSQDQVNKLSDAVPVPVDSSDAAQIPAAWKDKMQVAGGNFYIGQNPSSPQLGDVRISYKVVKPDTVSLVAVQQASTFAPFQAKAGNTILLVESGMHTAADMFKSAEAQNSVLTWILRGAGFFLMFLGIFLMFRPIAVFADVVPLFGTALGAGIGLFAFLGAAVLSFFTIAVAWVTARPVIGISLIVIAIAALIMLLKIGSSRKAARASAAAPAPVRS